VRAAPDLQRLVADRIADSVAVKQAFLRNDKALALVADVARVVTTSLRVGGKVLFFWQWW